MIYLSKFRFGFFVVLVIIHILLSGCSTGSGGIDQVYVSPDFSVALETNSDQETHASLVITNPGDTPFPATDNFNAEMNLWTSSGEPRSRIEANMIQAIDPGEAVFLSSSYWKLDPGVYFLTWGAPQYGGNITVFSIIENSNRVYTGETVSFKTKPLENKIQAANAGSISSFSVEKNGTVIIRGETPVPDTKCVFPIFYNNEGVVEDFPVGACAQVAEGQWQLTLPADPDDVGIKVDEDTIYQVILFSEDLTLPPSEPFALEISPPPQN